MCTYHEVAKVVEPKIATLRVAEDELKVATKEKNGAEERMAAVQAKLDEMQVRFRLDYDQLGFQIPEREAGCDAGVLASQGFENPQSEADMMHAGSEIGLLISKSEAV